MHSTTFNYILFQAAVCGSKMDEEIEYLPGIYIKIYQSHTYFKHIIIINKISFEL